MTLPVAEKSWEFVTNEVINNQGSGQATNSAILLRLKNSFKAFANNPCTVVGSAKVGSAGMDGQDRWVVATDIDGAAAYNSWIVLKFPGISANFQVLIGTAAAAQIDLINVWFSISAGFTGGSSGVRPTATDEVQIVSAANWGVQNSGVTTRWHICHSTDGQCTRAFFFSGNICQGMWLIDKVQDAVSGWTIPGIACVIANGSPEAITTANWHTVTNTKRGRVGATTFSIGMENIGSSGAITTFLNTANDISRTYGMQKVYVTSTSAGAVGLHGRIADLYIGCSLAAMSHGTTLGPSNAQRDWVKVGFLYQRWTGDSTIPLSS